MPDDIGHGKSSKPSDGLRAKFPRYGYQDMLTAEHALLTQGLGVNHLRLVMGTSMGGMHTWLWGERWPDFMDALMPLASVPGQISGRNRVWRRVVIDAIRNDPRVAGGQLHEAAAERCARPRRCCGWWAATRSSASGGRRRCSRPTEEIDAYVANWLRTGDANDQLYALEASRRLRPGPGPGEDQGAALRDQLRRRPDQSAGARDRWSSEIKRVPKGRAIVIPLSDKTAGHGTHTLAALWKNYLVELLHERSRANRGSARRRLESIGAVVEASSRYLGVAAGAELLQLRHVGLDGLRGRRGPPRRHRVGSAARVLGPLDRVGVRLALPERGGLGESLLEDRRLRGDVAGAGGGHRLAQRV